MDTEYHVVWQQRNNAMVYAHLEGGHIIWKKGNKRAEEFTWRQAKRFVSQFANGQSLLQILEA